MKNERKTKPKEMRTITFHPAPDVKPVLLKVLKGKPHGYQSRLCNSAMRTHLKLPPANFEVAV